MTHFLPAIDALRNSHPKNKADRKAKRRALDTLYGAERRERKTRKRKSISKKKESFINYLSKSHSKSKPPTEREIIVSDVKNQIKQEEAEKKRNTKPFLERSVFQVDKTERFGLPVLKFFSGDYGDTHYTGGRY